MRAVAKVPRIGVRIMGVGSRSVAAVLRKAIPGIAFFKEEEPEPIRGSGWFEALESELTPGRALRVYRDNAGPTIAGLSRMAGIPVRHLSGMQNDKRPIGKLNARRLAAAGYDGLPDTDHVPVSAGAQARHRPPHCTAEPGGGVTRAIL